MGLRFFIPLVNGGIGAPHSRYIYMYVTPRTLLGVTYNCGERAIKHLYVIVYV